MIVSCLPAQAWWEDEWYKAQADLPTSIQAALPEQMQYVLGMRGEDTVYVLLDEGNDLRRVYIFSKAGNDYQLECKSAPLAEWHSSKAGIGCSGGDTLHLIYDGGSAYFNFCRTHANTWVLQSVQAEDLFGIDAVGLNGYESEQYLCGTVVNTDLSTLNSARLPATLAEALGSMIDTDGWALLKSDKHAERLHLRTAPSADAASIGQYYSGAPVRLLEDQGEWAKVSVCDVQGYIMTSFLAFGYDMLSVERRFPGRYLIDEDAKQGVNVYASPDTNSAIVGVLRGDEGFAPRILATVGDGWYHVLRGDGLSGYVEARHFWDGNG